MISLRSVLDEGALKCHFPIPNKNTHVCVRCGDTPAVLRYLHYEATAHRTVMEAGATGAMTQEAECENTGGVNVVVERRVQTREENSRLRVWMEQQLWLLALLTVHYSPPLEFKPAVELSYNGAIIAPVSYLHSICGSAMFSSPGKILLEKTKLCQIPNKFYSLLNKLVVLKMIRQRPGCHGNNKCRFIGRAHWAAVRKTEERKWCISWHRRQAALDKLADYWLTSLHRAVMLALTAGTKTPLFLSLPGSGGHSVYSI